MFAPHLQMFDRSKDLPRAKAVPPDPVTVEVVRSMDQMARVIAIRGAVYMGEYLNAKFAAKRNPYPAGTATIRVPTGPPLAN